MAEFLDKHTPELCELLREPERTKPYWGSGEWFYTEGVKLTSNHTHHQAMWRVADFSMQRFAALRVGRKQKSFPDLSPTIPKLSVAVPYIKYGDFDPWPVLSPKVRKTLPELRKRKLAKDLKWCYMKSNGFYEDSGRAWLHLSWICPHELYDEIMAEVRKLGIEAGPEAWDKKEELAKPWLKRVTKPLNSFMTNLSIEWEKE